MTQHIAITTARRETEDCTFPMTDVAVNGAVAGSFHLIPETSIWAHRKTAKGGKQTQRFEPDAFGKATAWCSLLALAAAAKPINDDEWGSERQIAAQNSFFDAVETLVTAEVFDGLEGYCLKANVDEMIEAGLKAAAGTTKFTKYRSVK